MKPAILKQTTDEPLFPQRLWQRPLNRRQGGRLLIVGGSPGHLSEPQAIYQALLASGAGEAQLVYPDSLSKLLAGSGVGVAASSTPAGSLAKGALGEILTTATESDTVILAPSAGNNSETVILIESLLEKLEISRIVTGDALTAIGLMPALASTPVDQVIIAAMPELFRLVGKLGQAISIKPGADAENKLTVMTALTEACNSTFVLIGPEIIVATRDRICVTSLSQRPEAVESAVVGLLGTFWTQNPSARFEGLVTGAFLAARALAIANQVPTTQASFIAGVTTALTELDSD